MCGCSITSSLIPLHTGQGKCLMWTITVESCCYAELDVLICYACVHVKNLTWHALHRISELWLSLYVIHACVCVCLGYSRLRRSSRTTRAQGKAIIMRMNTCYYALAVLVGFPKGNRLQTWGSPGLRNDIEL